MQIHELPDGVIGETEYSPVDNGSTNRKVTLANIGAYVLDTLTMSLGGATRTVKAAIDAIQTKVGTATLNTTAQDLSGATNEIDAKIGSTPMGTTATTLTGAIAEHENDISILNSKIINYSDNIKMKYFIKSATVPNGSASAPSMAEIDISDQIPSGSTVCGAFVFLGGYLLPYVEAGSVKTWVYVVSNTMIRLANITTGWGTQTAYILIFYR